MVAPRIKKQVEPIEIDPFTDIVSAFRGVLGDMGQGQVKIFVKKDRDTRHAYVKSEAIGDGDFDTFIEHVRKDYPEGGDFLFRLCDERGIIKSTKQLALAPLPETERIRLLSPVKDNNNDMMIAMMNMQSNSSNQMMTMMMTMMSTMAQSNNAMLAAIVPAMVGNKGESAGELLSHLTQAQKNMQPEKPANSMMETLDMMIKMKEILPSGDGGGSDDSFGGLLKAAGPLLGGMLSATQNQQPAPQPQPQPQMVRQIQPQIQRPVPPLTHSQPAPQPQPQPQPETDNAAMLAQMQLIQKYDPIMKALKKLLEKGADEDKLADYIESQIDADVITQDDFQMLLEAVEEQPEQLGPLLGLWGITSENDIATVKRTIDQFLANDDNSNGDDGNEANPGDNDGVSDKGVALEND